MGRGLSSEVICQLRTRVMLEGQVRQGKEEKAEGHVWGERVWGRRKGQGGEWAVTVVELTCIPNVLILFLSVMEGSPAWEGESGKPVRG